MSTISSSRPVPYWLAKLKLLTSVLVLAWLAACGGGGGGSPAPGADASASLASPTAVAAATATTTASTATTVTTPTTATATSAPLTYTSFSVAQQCVTPSSNAGVTQTQGTIDTEKQWVRAFMDETYLWYKDIPSVDASSTTFTLAANGNNVFRTVSAYFYALLNPNRTASKKLVDEFSFTVPIADRTNQQAGISSGYGIRFARVNGTGPERVIRVLFVEPNSPGDLAGVRRGDTVKSVDGVDINDTTDAGTAKLDAGLSPSVASKTTVFGLQGANATQPCDVTVVSSTNVAVIPVPLAKSFTVGTTTVGYLVLNSFSIVSAQKQLIDSVDQLKSAGVKELVLDLRYNGGGFLAISNQLSWMIGDASLADKVYEKNICNDKNPFDLCNESTPFRQQTIADSTNNLSAGQALPQLGLKRVFVLTSASTCSASESLVNGLSPFLEVVRIGSTTCGKPYGFFYIDNCSTSYAAMQFRGVNANGFGDFADGFAPTCAVADDLSKERGDPTELMLAGALTYMKTGKCPPASQPSGAQASSQAGAQKRNVLGDGGYKMMRSPMEENRILNLPGSQAR